MRPFPQGASKNVTAPPAAAPATPNKPAPQGPGCFPWQTCCCCRRRTRGSPRRYWRCGQCQRSWWYRCPQRRSHRWRGCWRCGRRCRWNWCSPWRPDWWCDGERRDEGERGRFLTRRGRGGSGNKLQIGILLAACIACSKSSLLDIITFATSPVTLWNPSFLLRLTGSPISYETTKLKRLN